VRFGLEVSQSDVGYCPVHISCPEGKMVQNIAIRALAPERHLSTRTRASALRLYSISPLVVGQGNFSVTKERITDNARKLADVPRSVCEQSGRCEYFGCCLRRPFTDEQSPPGRLPYFAHPVLFPRFHALSRSQRIFTCALEVHANGLMGQGAKSRPTPPYFSTSEPSGRLSLFRKKSGSSKKTVRPLHGVHSTILDNGKPTSSSRSLAGTIAAQAPPMSVMNSRRLIGIFNIGGPKRFHPVTPAWRAAVCAHWRDRCARRGEWMRLNSGLSWS
jgi:hypothetical protein